jgi:hypothetical protein
MNASSDEVALMNKTYTVVVRNLIPCKRLYPDDRTVVGTYEVLVRGTDNHQDGDLCVAVLDSFHDSIAIKRLDDFEITVFNEQGCEVSEEEDSAAPEDVSAMIPEWVGECTGRPQMAA